MAYVVKPTFTYSGSKRFSVVNEETQKYDLTLSDEANAKARADYLNEQYFENWSASALSAIDYDGDENCSFGDY